MRNMKNILIGLILASIVIISGCGEVTEITPQNVDPIAQEIQNKYDTISAYEARIYQIRDDGSIYAGRVAAKKPDQYFDFAYWDANIFVHYVNVCNGQKDEVYTSESGKIDTYYRSCKSKVDNIFNVMDRIKKIVTYPNTVKQREFNPEDYKEILYLSPTSSYDKDKVRIVATTSKGCSVGEKQTEGIPGLSINTPIVEVIFTDELNIKYKLIFRSDNYQLLKSEKTSSVGKIETTYYSDLQFDENVNPRYFTMPTLEEINSAIGSC
jgi:outer membrane lipoprotein-sorting protein